MAIFKDSLLKSANPKSITQKGVHSDCRQPGEGGRTLDFQALFAISRCGMSPLKQREHCAIHWRSPTKMAIFPVSLWKKSHVARERKSGSLWACLWPSGITTRRAFPRNLDFFLLFFSCFRFFFSRHLNMTAVMFVLSLKTLTSLNKEVRAHFSYATIAFGVSSLFLSLAITALGGSESYLILAIIAFGAFEFIVPKYYYRLGKMESKQSSFLI